MVLNKVSIKYKCHYHSRLAREKVRTAMRAEKRDRQAGSLAWHGAQTCDKNVTIVTNSLFGVARLVVSVTPSSDTRILCYDRISQDTRKSS